MPGLAVLIYKAFTEPALARGYRHCHCREEHAWARVHEREAEDSFAYLTGCQREISRKGHLGRKGCGRKMKGRHRLKKFMVLPWRAKHSQGLSRVKNQDKATQVYFC